MKQKKQSKQKKNPVKRKHLIDILIPQYHETDEVIKPLLDSIALQQAVDFSQVGVVVVNDGSDVKLSDELLKSYPFEVAYYDAPHKGVSATRNACLDHSNAEYVMFCDADDMFYNMCGLWIVFREIQLGQFDSLISVFVEETFVPRPDGIKEKQFINHPQDSTFVHGKIHRRQYLVDKNIRWNEKLTIHEDSYFNILCQSLSTNVKYCQTPFYLWKWRDDSVCRHDPLYIQKTFVNMLASNEALVEEFLSRNLKEKARFFVAMIVFDTYYIMNKDAWMKQENQKYREMTEKRFKEYFVAHKKLWEEVSEYEKMQISNGIRQRNINEGMHMEAMTLQQWIDFIMKER